MPIQFPRRILFSALAVAWVFDLLFYGHRNGITFFIFTLVLTAAGLLLAWSERKNPASASLWLVLPIVFLAAFTVLRREPLTTFVNTVAVVGLLMVLAVTLLGGRWIAYTVADYIAIPFRLLVSVLIYPARLLRRVFAPRSSVPAEDQPAVEPQAGSSQVVPVVRGLLLAIPVLFIFGALLAAADPVFAQGWEDLLGWFRFENIAEYIFRGIYILILAWIFSGVYAHSLANSQAEKQFPDWLKPFLGWIEAAIILGSVCLLFAVFVGIQARYLFGGEANITTMGFTYAEYARRGFGELVSVAVLSLGLFLSLSSVTRRDTPTGRRIFSGLGLALVALVIVILISAFQRLLLYEQAYGFTRLRTYPHIFMIWLGILLVGVMVLELAQRQKAFALALLMACLGFAVSLNLINVDAFIARQNISRIASGVAFEQGPDTINERSVSSDQFDAQHLASLSTDAAPVLFAALDDANLSPAMRDQIATAILCNYDLRTIQEAEQWPEGWYAFHVSEYQARQLFQQHQSALAPYQVIEDEYYNRYVETTSGEQIPCYMSYDY